MTAFWTCLVYHIGSGHSAIFRRFAQGILMGPSLQLSTLEVKVVKLNGIHYF